MKRYCEVKLTDVLKEQRAEMSGSQLMVVKTLKRKNNIFQDINYLAGDMETKKTKKMKVLTKSNRLLQDNCSGGLKVGEHKTEISPGKRKIRHNMKSIEEPSDQIMVGAGSIGPELLSDHGETNIKNKKIKRKPRESCWENKLTGAKRVSKRLSNLRMEKQKLLKNLQSSVESTSISLECRQSIKVNGRVQMKSKKEVHEKPLRAKKISYYRNKQEVQFNFGKLRHTKRLYPKIASARRPPKFTVTVNPARSNQKSLRKTNKVNKHIGIDALEGNQSDPDAFIKTCGKDNQDETFNEDKSTKSSKSGINEDIETCKSQSVTIQSQCEEITKEKSPDQSELGQNSENKLNYQSPPNGIAEGNNEESQENEVQTIVCDTAEGEVNDGSTVVLVDIDVGKNVECEPERAMRNDQSTVSERKGEEEKLTEISFNLDEPSEVVHENSTIFDCKEFGNEEKITLEIKAV